MATQRSLSNAVKWSYTATWGDRAFSTLFTFILAALLGPQEFGVVSIAVVYILFLQMFLDQGLVSALIQRKNLEPEHLDAVFWMDLILSLVLGAVSILLSRWWAAVNHAPQVAAVISVLSLCIPIEGLAIVHKALLSREMDFKSLSIRSNLSVLAGGVVGIGMAYGGCGVWALVGQQIARDFSALILLWRLSPWRPRLKFSWKHLRDLMGFSVSHFVAQLGVFANTYASSVVIGVFFGPVAVGLYRLADRVMGTVFAAGTSSIEWVSVPEFSRLQDRPADLRESVLTCIRLSSTVTLPALALVAAVSDPLIASVGTKWGEAAAVLKILCVVGMLSVFATFTGSLLQALYRVRLGAALQWGRTAIGVAVLLGAGFFLRNSSITSQIKGIALVRLATGGLIITPVLLCILMRLARIPLRALLSSVAPSALAAGSVQCAVLLFHSFRWLSGAKPATLLGAELLIGSMTGVPILLLLDVRLRMAIIRLIKGATSVRVLAKNWV